MTKIAYVDETINPLIGCRPVSPACEHCYAVGMASRLARMPAARERYAGLTDGGRWTGETRWVPSELEKPLRWRKPKRIFWGSMGDVPGFATIGQLAEIASVIERTPQHEHIILTKRAERLAQWADLADRPLPNVLLGVTVEDQTRADERLPHMMRLAAAGWRTWASYEPALGPVNWAPWLTPMAQCPECAAVCAQSVGWCPHCDSHLDMHRLVIPALSWLVCGGESGPGARPMHPDWARAARDACQAAGVPYYHKQNGEWAPGAPDDWSEPRGCAAVNLDGSTAWVAGSSDGAITNWAGSLEEGWCHVRRVGKHAAGDYLDGAQHHEHARRLP